MEKIEEVNNLIEYLNNNYKKYKNSLYDESIDITNLRKKIIFFQKKVTTEKDGYDLLGDELYGTLYFINVKYKEYEKDKSLYNNNEIYNYMKMKNFIGVEVSVQFEYQNNITGNIQFHCDTLEQLMNIEEQIHLIYKNTYVIPYEASLNEEKMLEIKKQVEDKKRIELERKILSKNVKEDTMVNRKKSIKKI